MRDTKQGTTLGMTQRPSPGISLRSLDTPDGVIRWALYTPENVLEPMPLVVFLHGRGESGTDGTKQLAVGLGPALMLQRERWPAAVIFPQKPTQDILWPAHYDAVMQMIEITRGLLKIDENRISLTGLSQGGNGTWEFAARNPGMWSGIAPVCGFGDPAVIGPAVVSLPIWTFHGEKDTVIVPSRTSAIVDAVKVAGGSAKLTLYPDADHNSWDRAYRGEQLPEWLLMQRRK